jgi:hypothetical protein
MKIFPRLFQDPARNPSGASISKLYKTLPTAIRILIRKYKDLISIAQLFLKNRLYENKNPKTFGFGGESSRLESYFGGEVPVEKNIFQIKKEKRCCFALYL